MINDEVIKQLFFKGKTNRFTKKYKEILQNNEIKDYLIIRYNDSESLKETIYRIFYNIDIRPVCKICGNKVEFNSGANVYKNKLFKNCCCKECENKYRHINKTKAINEKYGVDNAWQSEEVKEKIKNITNLRYGGYTLNSEILRKKYEQTCLEKYGVKNGGGSKESVNKIKETCKKRYNVDNPYQIPEVKEKIKNTTYLHYNTYCILHNNKEYEEKIKNTMYNKYGSYYFSQSSYFIPAVNKTSLEKYNTYFPSQNKEIKEKVAYTCIKKYGYISYLSTPEMVKKTHTPEVIAKQLETKRINNSFNKSKVEDECYKLLINKFTNIIRQYKSDVYPYNCDFYIPEIDTYIEFNGSQYHHGHAFDKNNDDDIIELQRLINNDINSERTKKNNKESQ